MDEVFTRIPNPWRTTVSDYEVGPESYSQAVLDPERRKSMTRRCGTLDAGKEYDYNRNTCVSSNLTGKDISYAVGVLCRVLCGCPN